MVSFPICARYTTIQKNAKATTKRHESSLAQWMSKLIDRYYQTTENINESAKFYGDVHLGVLNLEKKKDRWEA